MNYRMQRQHIVPQKLQLLEGEISNYQEEISESDFSLYASDRTKKGIVAITAAAMGQSAGAGTVLASMDKREPGCYVEFEIKGQLCAGWIWGSLFKEGDQIKVAVALDGYYYRLYAVYRPEDGLISVFPHATKGRKAHIRASWKYFGYFSIAIWIISLLFIIYGLYGIDRPISDFILSCCGEGDDIDVWRYCL